jgi:hypothetical protein
MRLREHIMRALLLRGVSCRHLQLNGVDSTLCGVCVLFLSRGCHPSTR